MKEKMKKFGAWLLAVALAFAGAGAVQADEVHVSDATTLQNAFNNAASDATIVLDTDIATTVNLACPKDCVLDLAGHKIVGDYSKADMWASPTLIKVTSPNSFKLISSAAGGGMSIEGIKNFGFGALNGVAVNLSSTATVTFGDEGGENCDFTIYGALKGVLIGDAATVIVNGGRFDCKPQGESDEGAFSFSFAKGSIVFYGGSASSVHGSGSVSLAAPGKALACLTSGGKMQLCDIPAEGLDLSYGQVILAVANGQTYKVKQSSAAENQNQLKICAAENTTATVVLDGLCCNNSDTIVCDSGSGSAIVLELDNASTLTGGIRNVGEGELVIQDENGTAGSLKITASGYCAAIGGNQVQFPVGKNITIKSGTIECEAGYGAAIGGGGSSGGNAVNIKILGGTVTAKSDRGAAIGGGNEGHAEDVIISGGTVVASSDRGQAVGDGFQSSGSTDISVSCGTYSPKLSAAYLAPGAQQDENGVVKSAAPEVEVVTPTVNEEKGITQEIVNQITKNTEVAKVEDTGLKAALAEDETLKDAETVVKVELTKAAKDETGVLTYEIKPVVKGEGETPDVDISAKVAGKPITFRVPLTDAFSDVAKVTHKGEVDEISHVKVLGAAGARYVELTFTHFSEADFEPVNWPDATPVKIGDTFYASLGAAIEAGEANAEIYCKPGATIPVGNVHAEFLKSTTIYGNGAVLASSSEYSLKSIPADGKTYSIKVFNLGKIGLWDAVAAGVKIDILVEDCQDVHEVQIQGGDASSVVNTVVRNCTFDMVNGSAHMSGVSQDCGGSVLVEGCSFNGLLCGVNVKNDVGTLTTTVKDCTFVDCGLVDNKYNKSDASGDNTNLGAPIRVGSKKGATNAATIQDNAISYAAGSEKILKGDVIIGDNRPGKDAAGEVTYTVSGTAAKVDVYPVHGKLSGDEATAFTKDEEKSVELTATQSAEGNNEVKPAVAQIGEKKYTSLQEAFAAAGTAKNVTIELLSDVDLKDVDWPSIHFNGTFDGKGYTISNLKVAYEQEHSGFIRYSDGGAVVKNVTFKDSEITGDRASVVIGYGYGCTANNVVVDGGTITGIQKCGGIVAYVGEGAPLTITGCTVKNLKFVYADLEEDGNGGTSFGGLAGFVQYGVNAVITDNKVSGISFVGALDEATFEKYYGSIQDNEKYYQLTCHPFIAAVMGTVDQGVTTPVSVTLADNEVEQVSGLLIGPTTTEYMGFYYREGWTTRRVVDITVDGVLMPNRAVAQIGEAKYYSYAEAFSDAQDGGEIKIVASSVETPSNAFELQMKGDVTLVADEPMTATIAPLSYTSTVDNDGMAYIRSVSDAERKTLTIGENVTLAFPANAAANGAMYIGYSSSTPADVVVNGRIEAYLPYVGSLSTLTVNPSGSIKSISEDLIVRWGAKADIIGTDADWSEAKPQGRFGYVEQQGGVVTLTDTFVNGGAWWNVTDRNGKYADYPIALVLDGSTVSVSGEFKLAANTTVEMDAYSQIRAASVSNAGSINIVATGIADPVKVFDYTGKTAMTLDDYGTVTVTGGEAYVEDNDLWVKPLVAPPEVDVKDESGDPEVKDAEGKEIPEEKKEAAEQKAADVKTEVTQTLAEPEVAKFEGTGVAEAATETKQAGEEHQIIEVKPAVVEALKDEAETEDEKKEITKDSKVESRVEIVFDELEVKVDTSAEEVKTTETSVQYEVTPKVKTTVTVEGQEPKVVEAVIPNSVIAGNPIKFRLAVDSTFGDFARVRHTSSEDENFLEEYLAEVVTANDASGKKFVELSSDHFSTFKLTSTEETPVCRVGDKNYTSLAEAVEKGGDTAEIVLLTNIELTENVTLGYNQTIDPGEFAISGAGTVKADEGYEVRIVNGKSVVYAKPTEVTVAGDQKIAVCIEPTVLTELGGKDALAKTAANGFQTWQNYVMGVDGAVAGNKLVPICKPNAENPGAAAVTITTPMTFGAAPAKTGIAVTYQLLKSAMPKSGFTMVGEEQTVPVFAVDTSAEENATYWKIQAIFTPDAN